MTRIVWVDVFAPRPMSGNPLAVVLEPQGFDDARMQALAAELGLSETVFAFPPEGEDAAARLRIFTPIRELPMAGAPVVGAAWVLHADGTLGTHGALETGVGPLDVRVAGQVATMTQAAPAAGALVDPEEVGAACGLRIATDPTPQVWSTGVPQLMAQVVNADELTSVCPDAGALERLGERDGWVGISLYAIVAADAGRVTALVRHFAPRVGVLEDPGTGSAAGALGACLAAAGRSRDGVLELVVHQGAEIGRPSEIAVRVSAQSNGPSRVQVGGRVVPVFQGRLIALGRTLPGMSARR